MVGLGEVFAVLTNWFFLYFFIIDDYIASFIDDYGSSCLKPTQSTNSVMLYHNIQNFFATLKP